MDESRPVIVEGPVTRSLNVAEEPSYNEKLKSKRLKGLLSEARIIDLFDV